MFPIIDKRETGINIRKIMDRQGTDGKIKKNITCEYLIFCR